MTSLNSPTQFIGRRQPVKDSMTFERSRSICEGILQKRCRMSWRPRYVELLSDPTDFSGRQYSFQLMLFDPRRRMLKDKIRMEDIVTIRANQDCYFQIFLANGKILQLKADSIENEAYWIAMLKVGLGRGSIFHVRVNTPVSNLEHALLYSIGVNLPARRMGQLDRVLVLTSPINDVNIHAWDLNRVKTFMELEVGIRMELCSTCQYNQPSIITLVMERQFIKDCISFLCRETRISQKPSDEKGIPTYSVDHKCGYLSPPPDPAPPPPNPAPSPPDPAPSPSNPTPSPPDPTPPPPAYSKTDPELSSKSDSQPSPRLQQQSSQQSSANYVNVHDAVEETEPASEVEPPLLSHTVTPPSPANPPQPQAPSSEAQGPAFNFTEKDWDAFSDSGSHYLRNSCASGDRNSAASDDDEASYPPRNIMRKNYECSIPAIAQPYLNFQPYLFSSGSAHFEAPYQISSRITITDSGEVQYERNILGNMPMAHGGFHFKKQVPLPPRRMKQSQTTHPPSSKETSPKPPLQQPSSSNPGSQAVPGVHATPEPPTVLPKTGKKIPLFRTVSDQMSHPQSKSRNEGTRHTSEDDTLIMRSTVSSTSSEPRHGISPSYIHESVFFSGDTTTDKNGSSPEQGATGPKEEDDDYEDTVSLSISLRQKMESHVQVFPAPRPAPRPKPRPRRSKTVNVAHNGIQALNDNSTACASNGENSSAHNLDGSPPPSVKIATRGNDQAGLLDQEDWNGSHLGWQQRRITTNLVSLSPARKPQQRRPIPKPRNRAQTTVQVQAENASTANGALHSERESEREQCRSNAVAGESEML